MTRYAAETEVPVERSKHHIETLLKQHGADAYHTGWDQTRDIIEFGWQSKQIRFILPRPKREDYDHSEKGRRRTPAETTRAMKQADRQRWRALYLVVKAKLEAVAAGISIFEEEFMAFVVVPGKNQTIGEIMVPRIQQGTFDLSRALPEATEAR